MCPDTPSPPTSHVPLTWLCDPVCVGLCRHGGSVMPLMHSEDLADQTQCCALFKELEDEGGYEYAMKHK